MKFREFYNALESSSELCKIFKWPISAYKIYQNNVLSQLGTDILSGSVLPCLERKVKKLNFTGRKIQLSWVYFERDMLKYDTLYSHVLFTSKFSGGNFFVLKIFRLFWLTDYKFFWWIIQMDNIFWINHWITLMKPWFKPIIGDL